jgi:hypothetical protein
VAVRAAEESLSVGYQELEIHLREALKAAGVPT